MFIIIDGYNLMKSSSYFGHSSLLQENRKKMIQDLAQYKKLKNHSIILVFDAYISGEKEDSFEASGGIQIIYTKIGEKADQKIMELAKNYRDNALIVTNDREIIRFVESCGSSTVSSEAFESKVIQTVALESGEFSKFKAEDDE